MNNDLKYRYIQMVGGINAEELSKLEDIFLLHWNDTLMKEIQEQVECFERKINKKSKD